MMIDIIPDNLSCTDSDTREFFDTNEAPQNNDDDTEYLSDQDDNEDADATPKLHYLTRTLKSDINGKVWKVSYSHMVLTMMVAEQVGVRMMKEYFKIEASKATPQYGLRKGLKLFSDKRYQAAKNELKVNLLGRGFINMLSWKDLTWDIRKQALGNLMFLKRKQRGKLKGRGCTNGRPQQEYITKEESSLPTVSLYALMDSCVMDVI